MMIDVLKYVTYYYFIIFLHFYISERVFYICAYSTLFNTFYKNATCLLTYFSFLFSLKNEMIFNGIFFFFLLWCILFTSTKAEIEDEKKGRVPSKITNSCTTTNSDCLFVWFLSVDLSGLVVPARGSHASAGWVLRIIETHKPLHHGKVAVHKRGVFNWFLTIFQSFLRCDRKVKSIVRHLWIVLYQLI